MNDEVSISIIVPVYKTEKYLDECISSLVNQTYTNIEIILVDDGSPDNCPQMCDAWKLRDGRIKVLHKPNGGLSYARNVGIQAATGRWLLFIDSDDAVPVDFVDSLVSALTDEHRLVVSGSIRFVEEIPQYKAVDTVLEIRNKDLVSKRGGLYCWGALYSRTLVRKLGLQFDTTLQNIEDVVWNGIYLRYISDVVYVNTPYFYRKNPTSITSKCSDYKWQIASWIKARRSITNWFIDKPLSATRRKEVLGMFRHCQNNIYAECVAGNISYKDLHAMESEPSALFDQSLVPAQEKLMQNYFPKLYFKVYTLMIRAKNLLLKIK